MHTQKRTIVFNAVTLGKFKFTDILVIYGHCISMYRFF